jgi:hypothetical protein
MKRLLIPLLFAGLTVACSGDAPTVPLHTGPAFHLVTDGPLPFTMVGDCSQAVLVDPGAMRVADGRTIIQGRVFDCPTTGDIVGTNRVTWRNAVLGAGPAGGRVAGTTEVSVESFFGRTDLEGTFEGPFSGSLADLQFGESILLRTGTGDFRGLVMHGVFYQDPPASGVTIATGMIFGR